MGKLTPQEQERLQHKNKQLQSQRDWHKSFYTQPVPGRKMWGQLVEEAAAQGRFPVMREVDYQDRPAAPTMWKERQERINSPEYMAQYYGTDLFGMDGRSEEEFMRDTYPERFEDKDIRDYPGAVKMDAYNNPIYSTEGHVQNWEAQHQQNVKELNDVLSLEYEDWDVQTELGTTYHQDVAAIEASSPTGEDFFAPIKAVGPLLGRAFGQLIEVAEWAMFRDDPKRKIKVTQAVHNLQKASFTATGIADSEEQGIGIKKYDTPIEILRGGVEVVKDITGLIYNFGMYMDHGKSVGEVEDQVIIDLANGTQMLDSRKNLLPNLQAFANNLGRWWDDGLTAGDVIFGNFGDTLYLAATDPDDNGQYGNLRVAEYTRTLNANPGLDAFALERDMANPNWQMVPEFLNPVEWAIEGGLGAGIRLIRAGRMAKKATTLGTFVSKAIGVSDLRKLGGLGDEFLALAKKNNLVEGIMQDSAKMANRLAEAATYPNTARKVVTWLGTGGSGYQAAKKAQRVVGWMSSEVMQISKVTGKLAKADADQFFRLARTVADLASGNEKKIDAAVTLLTKENPSWLRLLTDEGMEGVQVLARTFDEFKTFGKTIDEVFEEGLNGKNWQKMFTYADNQVIRTSKKMFPTVAAMAKAGHVPYGFKAIARVHNWMQKYPYGWINKAYSVAYMGATPGYAVRNGVQNFVQTLFDEGVSGVMGWRKLDDAFDWAGAERELEEGIRGFAQRYGLRRNPGDRALHGMSKDLTAADSVVRYSKGDDPLKQNNAARKWWKFADMRVISNALEVFGSGSIFGKVFPQVMRQGLERHVTKRLMKEFPDIMSSGLAKNFERTLLKNKGNVPQTMIDIRDEIETSLRRVVGSEDMPTNLKKAVGDTVDVDELVRTHDSVDDAIDQMRDLEQVRLQKAIDDIKNEVPQPMIDIEDIDDPDAAEFFRTMADDVMAGNTSRKVQEVFTNYINANKKVNNKMSQALNRVERNIHMALKPVMQIQNKIDDFWVATSKSINFDVPEFLGGGKMSGQAFWGGELGELAGKHESAIHRSYEVAKREVRATSDAGEIEKIWKRLGMDKRHGSSLTKDKQEVLWALNRDKQVTVKEFWQAHRDTNVEMSVSYMNQMTDAATAAGAKGLNVEKTLVDARPLIDEARKFDQHVPNILIQDQISHADHLFKRGDKLKANKEYLLAYAKKVGLATLSENGAPLDDYLLRILNQELGRNFKSVDNLYEVSESEILAAMINYTTDSVKGLAERPNEALQVLGKVLGGAPLTHDETLQVNKMFDLLEDLNKPLRDEFGFTLYQLRMADKAGDVEATGKLAEKLAELGEGVETELRSLSSMPQMGDFLDLADEDFEALYKGVMKLDEEAGKKVAREGMSLRSEPVAHLEDNLAKAVGGVVDPEDAKKIEAFETAQAGYAAQQKKVQDALDAADDIINGRMEDFINKTPEVPENQWNEMSPPSQGRMIREGAPQEKQMYDDLEKYLRDNWNKTEEVVVKNKKELYGKLDKIERELDAMVKTQRNVASLSAEAVRDFVLHDYSDRKNFDLILGYIFPYHFWHSRTYAKWIQRIITRPGTIGAYVKMKKRLAEINEDLPDYMKDGWVINNLLGIDLDNPMIAQMEAFANPLQAIMKMPYRDEQKRQSWFARFLNDAGSFGPSPYTPYSVGAGLWEYLKGENEAGKKLIGRMVPQSRIFRAITSQFGPVDEEGNLSSGIEVDPFLVVQAIAEWGLAKWWAGTEPYEQNKIAKKLWAMVESGNINREQMTDAILQGPDNRFWRLAQAHAQSERNIGDMASFVGSPSFRTMTVDDMKIMEINKAMSGLYTMRDQYSEEEWAEEWQKLRETYPSMDALRLARSKGSKRDIALFYSVTSRLAPGSGDDIWEEVGVSMETINQIYETKGKALEEMPKADYDRVVNGITEMNTIMAFPPDAVQDEWDQVREEHSAVKELLLERYGEATVAKNDEYWSLPPDERYEWLDFNPDYRDYQNDRAMMLGGSDLLRKYYASFQGSAAMLSSRTNEFLMERFPGIIEEQRAYYDALAQGQKVKPTERLKEYWNAKKGRDELDGSMLFSWGNWLPDEEILYKREDIPEEGLSQGEKALEEFEYDKNRVPEYFDWGWEDWRQQFSPAMQRIVEDWAFRGAPLSESAQSSLEYAIRDLNVEPELARHLIREAVRDTDAEFYSPENPPTP